MTLQERILDSEQKFERKKEERELHLKLADECLTEMHKLQGEYRVLKELDGRESEAEPSKDPTSVDATPEGEQE